MLFGFADDGFLRELQSPSAKLSENNNEPVTMKRSEAIKYENTANWKQLWKSSEFEKQKRSKNMLHHH